jgi:hypothetical protein
MFMTGLQQTSPSPHTLVPHTALPGPPSHAPAFETDTPATFAAHPLP